jgi:hypothetical protein
LTLSKETKATLDAIYNSFITIEKLYQWSANGFEGCTLWNFYLDLIGYSQEIYGCSLSHIDVYSFSHILGYQELCLLGDALKVFEDHGYDQVFGWITYYLQVMEEQGEG